MLIVLIGHRAVGKTTLGQQLAQRLAVPFTDSDQQLAASHGVEHVGALGAAWGQERFRQEEAGWLERFLENHERCRQPAILALGAGAVETPWVQERLRGVETLALWLSLEQLAKRQQARGDPAWGSPHGQQEAMRDRRTHLYEQVAQHHLPLSGQMERDLGRLEGAIRALWQQRQDLQRGPHGL